MYFSSGSTASVHEFLLLNWHQIILYLGNYSGCGIHLLDGTFQVPGLWVLGGTFRCLDSGPFPPCCVCACVVCVCMCALTLIFCLNQDNMFPSPVPFLSSMGTPHLFLEHPLLPSASVNLTHLSSSWAPGAIQTQPFFSLNCYCPYYLP